MYHNYMHLKREIKELLTKSKKVLEKLSYLHIKVYTIHQKKD